MTGASSVRRWSGLVVFLAVASVGFLVAQDVVSVALWFEVVNLPLVGLLVVRPCVSGVSGVKGWVQAVWLLCAWGVVGGIALLVGLLVLSSGSDGVSSVGVLLVLLGAGVKLSVVPLHVWLGKVHAEACTVGSVLLAGVGLKLGWVVWAGVMPVLVGSTDSSVGVWLVVVLLGSVLLSCGLLGAVDVKRWVALYSVVHMGMLVGLSLLGVSAGILLVGMWGHSIIAGVMFLVIGLLCELSGVRRVGSLLCVSSSVPSLSILILLLCLANAAFPGSVLFWVECVSGSVLCASVPVLGFLLIVCSSMCLVSGLWVWHSISRKVRGTSLVSTSVCGVLAVSVLLLALVVRPSFVLSVLMLGCTLLSATL